MGESFFPYEHAALPCTDTVSLVLGRVILLFCELHSKLLCYGILLLFVEQCSNLLGYPLFKLLSHLPA